MWHLALVANANFCKLKNISSKFPKPAMKMKCFVLHACIVFIEVWLEYGHVGSYFDL